MKVAGLFLALSVLAASGERLRGGAGLADCQAAAGSTATDADCAQCPTGLQYWPCDRPDLCEGECAAPPEVPPAMGCVPTRRGTDQGIGTAACAACSDPARQYWPCGGGYVCTPPAAECGSTELCMGGDCQPPLGEAPAPTPVPAPGTGGPGTGDPAGCRAAAGSAATDVDCARCPTGLELYWPCNPPGLCEGECAAPAEVPPATGCVPTRRGAEQGVDAAACAACGDPATQYWPCGGGYVCTPPAAECGSAELCMGGDCQPSNSTSLAEE